MFTSNFPLVRFIHMGRWVRVVGKYHVLNTNNQKSSVFKIKLTNEANTQMLTFKRNTYRFSESLFQK